MKITLLQINPTVGDLSGNAALMAAGVRQAARQGADLVITPRLALVGYPPRDLLLNSTLIRRCQERLEQLATELAGMPPVLLNVPLPNPAGGEQPLIDAAVLLAGGRVAARLHLPLSPTGAVWDDDRYFAPAPRGPQVLEIGGRKIAVTVGADTGDEQTDPIAELAQAGADCVINIAAAPFSAGRQQQCEKTLGRLAARHRLPIVSISPVGGNDDLVFAGRSAVLAPNGELVARAQGFAPDIATVQLPDPGAPVPSGFQWGAVAAAEFAEEAEIWQALVLGTRDFVHKCGMQRVLLGLSGGIDSALVAAVAVAAFGPDNVLGVLMPSPFSSPGSIADALALARNLGIATEQIPIAPIMSAFETSLSACFAGTQRDTTEENLQARIRGTLLMAISNKKGAMLLNTGNKSEVWVGYCTLYGDTNGALGVIADVPKTMVYRIARWLNRDREVIPVPTITKAPSAELRPNQTDQDSLPPYDVLDEILYFHVERREWEEEIVARGYDPATVQKVLRLVQASEFKRKQAAPGLKVTTRALRIGWRMPIAKRINL